MEQLPIAEIPPLFVGTPWTAYLFFRDRWYQLYVQSPTTAQLVELDRLALPAIPESMLVANGYYCYWILHHYACTFTDGVADTTDCTDMFGRYTWDEFAQLTSIQIYTSRKEPEMAPLFSRMASTAELLFNGKRKAGFPVFSKRASATHPDSIEMATVFRLTKERLVTDDAFTRIFQDIDTDRFGEDRLVESVLEFDKMGRLLSFLTSPKEDHRP